MTGTTYVSISNVDVKEVKRTWADEVAGKLGSLSASMRSIPILMRRRRRRRSKVTKGEFVKGFCVFLP